MSSSYTEYGTYDSPETGQAFTTADGYATVKVEENPRTTDRLATEDADRSAAVDADVIAGLAPVGDPRSVDGVNGWAVSIAQGD